MEVLPAEELGPLVRSARERRGLTLHELSEVSGIAASELREVEGSARTPALDLLLRLARSLGEDPGAWVRDDAARGGRAAVLPDPAEPSRTPRLRDLRRTAEDAPLPARAATSRPAEHDPEPDTDADADPEAVALVAARAALAELPPAGRLRVAHLLVAGATEDLLAGPG